MLAVRDNWPQVRENVLADLAPGSAELYARYLDRFRKFMVNRQLDKAAVATFRNELIEEGLSPSSVNGALTAVRRLIDEMAQAGYIPIPRYIDSLFPHWHLPI